ncbi:MAG TPA: aldose 1-epimerase family protein [Acidimicrobiales bacterium]|nr:aldose 1-epimerase family protein [Acidimicrobiales bacterium]
MSPTFETGSATRPPSGEQFELCCGSARACVVEVGGGIRSFELDGAPVLLGYRTEEMCTGGKGQVLAPWPNRLDHGHFTFDGRAATAALDEPERRNAIHGLVRWVQWRGVEQQPAKVRLATELEPQPGYPWRLALEVGYTLSQPAGGGARLDVVASAENLSGRRAPFGIGFHPYVDAGEGGADLCSLELKASSHLVTNERGLPIGAEPVVRGGHLDFTGARLLEGIELDDCFSGLAPASVPGCDPGWWAAHVTRGDGSVVTVSAGPMLPYVMCFTADTLPEKDRRRGIALEPMSCPPNALATGEALVVLEPGGPSFEARWSITVTP